MTLVENNTEISLKDIRPIFKLEGKDGLILPEVSPDFGWEEVNLDAGEKAKMKAWFNSNAGPVDPKDVNVDRQR
tara:strand:- start:58 stop:279 length:222 start_codon:yes stop_codon:yes gene_type:complete